MTNVSERGETFSTQSKFCRHFVQLESKLQYEINDRMDRPGFALLIDGDNISAEYASQIGKIAQNVAPARFRRVYGDASRLPNWEKTPGFRVIHSGSGKNSADILLAIDAIELACCRQVDTVMIVSSDGDFSHLATRLIERGVRVIGSGEDKSPPGFRAICSEFHILRPRSKQTSSEEMRACPNPQPAKLHDLVRNVVSKHDSGSQGVPLVQLNGLMRASHDVRISNHPDKTWRGYLSKRQNLFRLTGEGQETRVHVHPASPLQ